MNLRTILRKTIMKITGSAWATEISISRHAAWQLAKDLRKLKSDDKLVCSWDDKVEIIFKVK